MASMTPDDTVEQRLQLFQDVRLPRCAATQLMSNGMFYSHALDKQEMIHRHYQGPLPPQNIQPWSEPIRDFFYAYDVFEESKKAIQYKDQAGGVPDGVLRYFWPPC
jgi:salicylate hydroxylase